MGDESIEQLADDTRHFARAYPVEPLGSILQGIGEIQETAFSLLEGRQKPGHARDLYLIAGVSSGMMAKASHDLGAPHEALAQARTAYACADNADHHGLRAWIRGLQSLITYWSGRFDESLRYAQRDSGSDRRVSGTSAVWLVANEARVLAALGRTGEARDAIDRAFSIREAIEFDELDELGGICTFTRPRQLYYAADALRWAGAAEAEATQRLALDSLDAYGTAPAQDQAFGDEAGTRCALAAARIERGEIDGAAEAISPVLALPTSKRIRGVISSAEFVGQTLTRRGDVSRVATELAVTLTEFSASRLALPS